MDRVDRRYSSFNDKIAFLSNEKIDTEAFFDENEGRFDTETVTEEISSIENDSKKFYTVTEAINHMGLGRFQIGLLFITSFCFVGEYLRIKSFQ